VFKAAKIVLTALPHPPDLLQQMIVNQTVVLYQLYVMLVNLKLMVLVSNAQKTLLVVQEIIRAVTVHRERYRNQDHHQ